MSRPRRLAVTAASIAVISSFVPGAAFAADPSRTPTAAGSPAGAPAGVATELPKPAAFRTVSSPAAKSVRVQRPAADPVRSRAAGTGRTIHVTSRLCATDTGDGSEASPYCSLQHGVDVAVSGDTVQVSGTDGPYTGSEAVTVTTSGISILGTDRARLASTDKLLGRPVLTLKGVSDVTVGHLALYGGNAPAVQVIGSTRVTLDSGYLSAEQTAAAVTIDGASSDVTVSRSYVDTGEAYYSDPGSGGRTAIAVASGARRVTVAGNLLAAAGVKATDVVGLNVTGNTIQRGCASAVDVAGASTAVSIQNNLIEDEVSGSALGGGAAYCAGRDLPWAPHITVAEASAAGTTADYNDFYVGETPTDATAPYRWAGTDYATLAAFRAAQPLGGRTQAEHDTLDTVGPVNAATGPDRLETIALTLQAGSAAIGSANPAAPGALATDYYGSAYGQAPDRGAVKYLSTNPGLAVGLTATDTSAFGITLEVKAAGAPRPQYLTVDWGDGSPVARAGFTGTEPGGMKLTTPHSYQELGTYTVTVTDRDQDGNAVTNSVQVATTGSEYAAYGPARLLDTRTGGPATVVQPRSSVRVRIGGNGGIPTGVTAAVLNLTVTRPTAPGYLTAFPAGHTRPATSNVNFVPGQTVPGLAIVPVGEDGYVELYNGSEGTVDVVADISGYFTRAAAAGYTPVTPKRLVDTRNGTGAARRQLGGGESFAVQIAGAAGGALPTTGVTAVALNVTVTGTKAPGFLTAYPDGAARPVASNVNFGQDHTIANAVIVPVGDDGQIRIYDGGGASDVIVDVVGYYGDSGGSAYLPVNPTRVLDTRGPSWHYGPIPGGKNIYLNPGGSAPDKTSFAVNTTVTNTKSPGYLTVAPDANSEADYRYGANPPVRPTVSSLNWLPGQVVPNFVQATPGPYGLFDLWNGGLQSIDLVTDLFGYYQND
ncbi:N-acetylmuramoyl-L-alanine amidase [Kitasatospora sp. MMS16-BH015]|uniref:right-handed parallel beta-helix repeat-containing protein n=1 Tax=Kitasatospora sp. MMS16-BH015 TaxID=2018025 RepID=UPI000CA26464|nr:right-handed parallel beta-helix repeat-containing protein [Kitasatospora sp. MMS16-BH015]AUG78131.1 N-acetylmuramoyl-L-alanine amidase [Kitasatospora sp. MMS16-BH015]